MTALSRGALLLTMLVLVGCRGGFHSTATGANAPSNFSPGVSNSLRFSDEGGVLTRVGLGIVGTAAAFGAIENPKVTTTTTLDGDKVIIDTKKEATINTDTAKKAVDITNAKPTIAEQDKGDAFSASAAANFEIAGQTLGGDTSGGQFDFGVGLRHITAAGPVGLILRAYLGFGYGSFTLHDRMERIDRGPPMFGDAHYKFIGFPTRIGAAFVKRFDRLSQLFGVEAFAKANLNLSDASIYAAGARVQYFLFFVEVEANRSSTGTGTGFEVGIGF